MKGPMLASKSSVIKCVADVCSAWAESRSKDPSSKVGAAVYDQRTGAMHLGYNGFPQGLPDREDWWLKREGTGVLKYDLVVHAEANAVRKALMSGGDPADWILVCTHVPCAQCIKDSIASTGIKKVFYLYATYPSRKPHDDEVMRFFYENMGIQFTKVVTC